MTTTERRHELTITVRTAREKGVEAVNDTGRVAKGKLNLDDPLILATLEVFEDLLRRDQVTRNEELSVLGSYLYRALFTGSIEDLFQDELKEARVANKRLRLQLTFTDEQEALISLPWEFLYCPDTRSGDFLATRVDLVLARFFPLGQNRTTLRPADRPLKILVAVSRPENLDTIVAQPVIEAIEKLGATGLTEADGSKTSAGAIQVSILKQPNTENLIARLDEFKPHIFHFIGHGRFAGNRAQIAFTQLSGNQVFWCDDTLLVKCFQRAQTFPRLVFLQMCEGGEMGVNRMALTSFTGFAPRLLSAEIPAVVAMKYVIRNGDAIKFSQTFYTELAKGKGIDEAVQLGRDQIGFDHGYSNRVFGTPILFLHSYDGIIQPPPPARAEAAGDMTSPAAPTGQPPPTSDTTSHVGPASGLDVGLSGSTLRGSAAPTPESFGRLPVALRLTDLRGSPAPAVGSAPGPDDLIAVIIAAAERKMSELGLNMQQRAAFFAWLASLEPDLRGKDKAAIQSLLLQYSQTAGSDLTLIQVLLAMTLSVQ